MAYDRHQIILRVTSAGYEPHDEAAVKQHSKFPVGVLVGAKIARSRSIQHHRLYWKVLQTAVEATGKWETAEALHQALKVATGRIEIVRLMDGRLIKIPQSTSFDEMPQDEFTAYCTDAFRILSDCIGVPVEQLLEEAHDYA
jgi:hypothetical protein